MTAEPLKNKYKEYAPDLWEDKVTKERLGQEAADVFDDIKLAVEWLKKELVLPHATDEINKWFQDKIKEAFADLKVK